MAKRMTGEWALVRRGSTIGKDSVLSTHATRDAAENAMRKKGGIPDTSGASAQWTKDANGGPLRVYNVSRERGYYEVIDAFGWTIRPNMANWHKRDGLGVEYDA